MASLIGEPVGRTVGFARGWKALSHPPRIEVVTTGLLVRRLLGDPGLDGVSVIILDEIHERSLEADLALALCLDAQAMLRPDLRLLAMSATLDGASSAIMNAPIVAVGRMHPVEIVMPPAISRTHGSCQRRWRALFAPPWQRLQAISSPSCPAWRKSAAQAALGLDAAVLPLHGDLPLAAQDLALRPSEGRRVVLATAIAETSLTVPGVRIVIDGGFDAPALRSASGLTRL
jgi:ATP-dependent helicase HrpB